MRRTRDIHSESSRQRRKLMLGSEVEELGTQAFISFLKLFLTCRMSHTSMGTTSQCLNESCFPPWEHNTSMKDFWRIKLCLELLKIKERSSNGPSTEPCLRWCKGRPSAAGGTELHWGLHSTEETLFLQDEARRQGYRHLVSQCLEYCPIYLRHTTSKGLVSCSDRRSIQNLPQARSMTRLHQQGLHFRPVRKAQEHNKV